MSPEFLQCAGNLARVTLKSHGRADTVRKFAIFSPEPENSPVSTIYKISPASAWREAERQGVFRGSPDDLRDGFIHFSTRAQVEATASRHFAGQTGLVLIAVDADLLGDKLKWERSRGGDLFPHLYGAFDLSAVTGVFDLRMRADGAHVFPEEIA